MAYLQLRRAIPALLALTLIVSLLTTGAKCARAYTPESPEVKAMIERGLGYLDAQGSGEQRLGGKCLLALTYWKNGRPADHPSVQAAIAACRDGLKALHNEIYSPALALIFLCEMEDEKPELRDLADSYLQLLLKLQKPHGGFGYGNLPTGDTSQTQYGALGMWMAANHGHTVPQDNVERLCGWLVRTQDVSGTWGYQGNDPGGYTRIRQNTLDFRLSLHVGGAGSMYVAADLLKLLPSNSKQGQAETKLPPALRAVGQPEEEKRRGPKLGALKLFDPQLARNSIADADKFFAQNYQIDPKHQVHYYLYGLERYQSYRELAAGKWEPEPKWYNDGCKFLMDTQIDASGAWAPSGDSTVVGTCFAILFLARSSRKSIAKINPNLGDGILLGGMGLPPNVADIVERDGKIVETPLAGSIDEMLALIEKPNVELDALVDPRQPLKLDGDVTKRAGQVARLRALVSAGSYEARLLAVKTLGRTRELDNVPVLIYALSDPDLRIVRAADRALRFYSRKFSGVGLPDEPKPAEVAAATKAWKSWYKSIRPEADFLD